MSDIKVKICGISDLETLEACCELNIDYAGFIFFEASVRNVDPDFLAKLHEVNFGTVRPVCVFVNPSEEEVYSAISYFENPILQFHGDETIDLCESFGMDYWKAIRMESKESLSLINEYESADAILLETYKAGMAGGTGESFNWDWITKEALDNIKIILSGGINLKNVDNGLNVNPWCLDINSGVESEPGMKDTTLITKIVETIRL
jgi:phosphoribosylanthranilate isomerase